MYVCVCVCLRYVSVCLVCVVRVLCVFVLKCLHMCVCLVWVVCSASGHVCWIQTSIIV